MIVSKQRLRGWAAGALAAALAMPTAGASAPAAAPAAAAAKPAPTAADFLPQMMQLVRLAALDPGLAASLVPTPWLDLLIDSVRELAAEEATTPKGADAPLGAVGPWPSPEAFAKSLEALDPVAVAALYRAARPRIAERCRAKGVPLPVFDRALRASGERVAARAVFERASGATPALTPTQREIARLGVPAVLVMRRQVIALGTRLWGAGWAEEAA
jgi:hypothetical protein